MRNGELFWWIIYASVERWADPWAHTSEMIAALGKSHGLEWNYTDIHPQFVRQEIDVEAYFRAAFPPKE